MILSPHNAPQLPAGYSYDQYKKIRRGNQTGVNLLMRSVIIPAIIFSMVVLACILYISLVHSFCRVQSIYTAPGFNEAVL